MALYDEAGGQRTEFAINQLRMMQEFAQAPGLTPLSSNLRKDLLMCLPLLKRYLVEWVMRGRICPRH